MDVPSESIWQRVLGAVPPDAASLLPLIAGILSDAAVYQYLSRKFTGQNQSQLQQLSRQSQSHAACLKGIYFLVTGERPVIRIPSPDLESPEITLRRCCGREMQRKATYEARTGDPEYGPVFADLAQETQRACRTVLEILGSLAK